MALRQSGHECGGCGEQHANLFLLCVSNLVAPLSAFTQSMLTSEMGSVPYLILEIDAHTADAGVQTGLEAFLDIVGNYRAGQVTGAPPFKAARLIRRSSPPQQSASK